MLIKYRLKFRDIPNGLLSSQYDPFRCHNYATVWCVEMRYLGHIKFYIHARYKKYLTRQNVKAYSIYFFFEILEKNDFQVI